MDYFKEEKEEKRSILKEDNYSQKTDQKNSRKVSERSLISYNASKSIRVEEVDENKPQNPEQSLTFENLELQKEYKSTQKEQSENNNINNNQDIQFMKVQSKLQYDDSENHTNGESSAQNEETSSNDMLNQYLPNFEKSQLELQRIEERSIEQSMSTVSKRTRFNNETINSKIIFKHINKEENHRGSAISKKVDIIQLTEDKLKRRTMLIRSSQRKAKSNYMNGDNLINRNIIEKLNEVANQQNEEVKNLINENDEQEMDQEDDLESKLKQVRESLAQIQTEFNQDENYENEKSHDFDNEDQLQKEDGEESPGGVEPYESANSSFSNNMNFIKGIHTRQASMEKFDLTGVMSTKATPKAKDNFSQQLKGFSASKQQSKKIINSQSFNKIGFGKTFNRQNTATTNNSRKSSDNDLNFKALHDPFAKDIKYQALDDDAIDKMLENFIKTHKVKVPINRISQSKYLFGTKLINAVIINGVLMVRVGGGFMTMEEFVDKHSNIEIKHLTSRMAKEKKKLPKIIHELLEKHKVKNFI